MSDRRQSHAQVDPKRFDRRRSRSFAARFAFGLVVLLVMSLILAWQHGLLVVVL
jgi:hypothetical protein